MTKTQVFHNFNLFDGVNPQVRPDCWMEVAGSRIQRVGSGSRPLSGEDADLEGRTVIPGMIDAHVHVMSPFADFKQINEEWLYRQIRLNIFNCIRCGVTTVRDMGAAPGLIQKVMHWVNEGKAVGPRIVRANSFIIPPGATPEHVPTFPSELETFFGGQITERVSTPEQVRDKVRRMVALGADWIKTTHTDKAYWLNQLDPPVFDDACFKALVDEAGKNNRPVAMHQTWASGFRKAVELGVDSMEHAPMDALKNEDIHLMVESGIPIVPTMSVLREHLLIDRIADWIDAEGETYLCPQSLDQTRALLRLYHAGITPELAKQEYFMDADLMKRQVPVMMENVRRLHAAGAVIGCGTDAGGSSFTVFGRFYEEIENLLEVGLTPFEALRSATAVNARILRLDDNLGTLEPGKLADFVVLDGNPLTDIMALRRVRMVVKEGLIMYKEGI